MYGNVDHPAKIITVSRNTTVEQAAAQMHAHKVGCLVVNDNRGKFAGIVTERDIVNRVIAPSRDAHDITVAQIMTADVVSCAPDTPTSKARETMAANGIRHLPIVDDDQVVGMLSARDLMGRQLLEDRAAAEDVAMLSTCLKSIDINEVAEIVTREVPKLFQARRCVLCFHREGSNTDDPALISCNECVCPREHLSRLDDAGAFPDAEEPRYDSIPEICEQLGGQSPRLVIPLRALDKPSAPPNKRRQLRGYLCMCNLASLAATNRELVSYKAKLTREILTSHLTNASLYQQARLTSLTDALTGVGSRKLLEDKLQSECARAKRYKRPFSVAIIDLDNFKMINDVLGHATGDDALVQLAACMKRQKRTPDVLTRYGGDEFVVLMPETRAQDAVTLMERLRAQTSEIKLSESISITVSCGVASSLTDEDDSPRDIMRRADLALYAAKSAGRNCVKIWDETMSNLVDATELDVEKIRKLQLRIAGLSEQAEKMFIQSIWGLVQALEAKDSYAKKHSENVTHYATAIAKTMRIGPRQLEVIRRAAMIHDIGKIGVPDTILTKPDMLTPHERSIVEQHPIIAVRILEKMTFLEREIALVKHHHEKWNGQGYPDGLSGAATPLGARILATADTFDALTSNRSYRASRTVAEAVKMLIDSAGYEFDPEVVKCLKAWIENAAGEMGRQLDQLTTDDLLTFQRRAGDNTTTVGAAETPVVIAHA